MAQDGNGEDEPGKVIHLRDPGRPHRDEPDPMPSLGRIEIQVDLLVAQLKEHNLKQVDLLVAQLKLHNLKLEAQIREAQAIRAKTKALRDSRVLWEDTPEGKRAIMESFFPTKPKWRP